MKKKTKNKSATKQKAVHRNEKIKRNVSDNTYMSSGFNAFGKPVPRHRLMNGYDTVKEMIPDISTEKAFSIVASVANHIEKDRPFEIIGNQTSEDSCKDWLRRGICKNQEIAKNDLGMIDLTGRYRLLAVMLTG